MNKKGTRATNGEGYVGNTIQRIDRRKNRLNFICDICKNCNDWSFCDNRIGSKKCQKCTDCEKCLEKGFCDRFYCYPINQVQITIDGKQTTVANEKKKKDAIAKKKEAEAKVFNNTFVKKHNITILDIIKIIDDEKFSSGKIQQTTKSSNKYKYKKFKDSNLNQKSIQNVTYHEIQSFLDSQRESSQSEINKLVYKLNNAFDRAVRDGIIAFTNNPMHNVNIPISFQNVKEVQAFELEEEIKLLRYLCTHKKLIKSQKCNYDDDTIRNLIIISLLSLMRIGELGSLDINEHINLEIMNFIIKRTLTKDENEKIILGEQTKTGQHKRKQGIPDVRYVPFSIFDKDIVFHIVKAQIKISQNNPNNKDNLLFCGLDGSYIDHRSITNIFKRICRDAGIKLELPEGCHIHMTRHTGVTRLIEFGMDLMVIASFTGHTSRKQIEETYAHILQKFRNWQIEHPNQYFHKEDLITPEIKSLLLGLYK